MKTYFNEYIKKHNFREVIRIAAPAVIVMSSYTIMGLVDTLIVGKLGTKQLAAVGMTSILIWCFYSLFNGTSKGITTFVSQYHGARSYRICGYLAWQGLYFSLISGIIIISIRFIGPILFQIINPPEEISIMAVTYFQTRLLEGIFISMNFAFYAFFLGVGNTRTPMKIAIAANILNAFLDIGFVFGKFGLPEMGLKGAAIATVLASFFTMITYIIVFSSKYYAQKFNSKKVPRFNFYQIRRILRIGIPMGIQFFMDIFAFFVFTIIISRLGILQLAANHIALQILSVSFMPAIGISMAATTLVGQYIGAGKHELAKISANTSLQISLAYAFFIAVLFISIPSELVSVFRKDPDIIKYGTLILKIAAVFQIFDAISITSVGALKGAGDAKWVMWASIGYAWLLFIPLAYFLGIVMKLGIIGAWAGATVYIITLSISYLTRFRMEKWKEIKI